MARITSQANFDANYFFITKPFYPNPYFYIIQNNTEPEKKKVD